MDETGLLELWVPHIYMCMCASAFENASLSFQISAFGKNQTRLELEQKLWASFVADIRTLPLKIYTMKNFQKLNNRVNLM